MASDLSERLAVVETKFFSVESSMERLRNHISELLTFKNKVEGGMSTVKWLVGAGLLTNLAMMIKMFFGHG